MKGEYPTEEDLKFIKEFDVLKTDIVELISFIKNIWKYADIGYFKFDGHNLELHTAGWSGNEEIIETLKENTWFWNIYWQKSERGGHYYFNDSMIKVGDRLKFS